MRAIAIAVAVYGSSLATVLGSDIADSIGAHAGAGHAAQVASQAAGGDLSRAAEISGATDWHGFLDSLTQAYDSAFHTVLWGLAVACLVLCTVVFALLRGGNRREQRAA
ncbi:hypothetical protein [Streptomyces sp. NPDC088246]|uniref:hypothetical protein n=1 Tax=Streptomyces sp. NPDC088246 TaxID=3365842 RepID=UPI00382BC101